MLHHSRERCNDFPASRIISAHAPQPQAVLLGPVIDRKLLLGNELVPLRLREPHRISVLLQIEKELGSVIVLPGTGIHSAAPQSNDGRQMLDTYWTLVLARAACCALEDRLL